MKAFIFMACLSSLIHAEPPRQIPPDLWDAFTMQGAIPVFDWYLDHSSPEPEFKAILENGLTVSFYPKALINQYIAKVQRKESCYYGDTDLWLYQALEKYPIRGKDVGIIGSTTPWYESLVIAYGGRPTTIEYNKIATDDDRLRLMTVEEYEQNPQKFDLILSISSIEHDGLGRYGDPINPTADLEFMGTVKAKFLKTGGTMLLAVPIGQDCLYWNAHRVYGRKRLPLLLLGWKIVETFGLDESEFMGSLGNFVYQPIFYLTPGQK